jgi:Fic family protein
VLEELDHRFEVRLTHHSTALEGNTLTQSETQIVLEKGVTIGGKSLREHLEVIGHKEALDFVRTLAQRDESLDERVLKEIHALVMKGQGNGDSGRYRSLDVKAAGTEFVYPSHFHVPELMSAYVAWLHGPSRELHPVEQASAAHLRFVTIHPFRDGNGRVGRLILNLLLLRAGYPIAVVPLKRRNEYINALVEAQQHGDASDLLSLVMDAVETSLRETLQVCISASGLEPPQALLKWLEPR